MMLYSVILCDQDCEARCESTTTTAQRLLHSEYPHITQCLTLACCGEICEVFTDKQGRSRLHSTQCVAGDLQVFGRCAGIAKTNVSNRESPSSKRLYTLPPLSTSSVWQTVGHSFHLVRKGNVDRESRRFEKQSSPSSKRAK
jgi:hypothetical protein